MSWYVYERPSDSGFLVSSTTHPRTPLLYSPSILNSLDALNALLVLLLRESFSDLVNSWLESDIVFFSSLINSDSRFSRNTDLIH